MCRGQGGLCSEVFWLCFAEIGKPLDYEPLLGNFYVFWALLCREKIIPNLRDPVEVYEALRNIISTSREQDWDHLNDAIVDYQRRSEQKALERIAADLPVRRDQEQIPLSGEYTMTARRSAIVFPCACCMKSI